MGTREGEEKLPLDTSQKPATKRQQDLIRSVAKKLPDTAQYQEYPKYQESQTRKAATDFLNAVLKREEGADDLGKLVTYMAVRSGVAKLGKHGLFSQTDAPIDLEQAAEEVANHGGYIWTYVVSLHREDAERLGCNNTDAWKSLVRGNMTTITEAHKIPVSDLQWCAAFHNTGHHPHIHLLVYSNGQKGHLSKQGIESMRSNFGNDIFRQEQYQLFHLQTELRQEVKELAEQRLRDLVSAAESKPQPTVEIYFLLTKLCEQLDEYHGKKVYDYLPKPIKATVNEIVAQLSSEPNIAKLYDDWNRINREKHSLYYKNKDPSIPLAENKEFRSINKMIVKAALDMKVEMVQESKVAKSVSPVVPAEQSASVICDKEPNHRPMAVAKGLIGSLARMIGGKCMARRQALQGQIDSRLRKKINRKNRRWVFAPNAPSNLPTISVRKNMR